MSLTREQKLAMGKFVSNLRSNFVFLISNPTRSLQISTGYTTASYVPFKLSKVPRGGTWTWNQSNKKVCVRISADTIVTIRKASPKRKYLDSHAPSYKLWMFHEQTVNQEDRHFLWCEKGKDDLSSVEIGIE